MRRLFPIVLMVAIAAVACGSSDEPAASTTTVAPTTTGASTTSTAATTTTTVAAADSDDAAETTTTTAPSTTTTTTTPEPPPEIARTDLLTFAQGAVFVSQEGLSTGSSGNALRVIDGDPLVIALTTDATPQIVFTYKLPAPTTFGRFAIPSVEEAPGNATFFKSIVISGSSEGPDGGFEVLAEFELETHAEPDQLTEILPTDAPPVIWIRVEFSDGILIEEGQEGRTNLEFSEIIGNGTQDTITELSNFAGNYGLAAAERPDGPSIPMQLFQDGSTLTGCLDDIVLTGSVNGRIARLTGVDPDNPNLTSMILVDNGDEPTLAAVSLRATLFSGQVLVDDPDATTPCAEEPPAPTACGVDFYVNFDVDSAVIRPESAQVLSDIYDLLVAEQPDAVRILGHTSTEGSEDYNLDLSQRRAQAVVDDLVGRGLDAALITAEGLGESTPLISPDPDETSREINRRVEIACG